MEQKQNKKNQRNKTPLVLALLLLLTLVVYTSHAYFSDSYTRNTPISLTVGRLEVTKIDEDWQRTRNGEVVEGSRDLNDDELLQQTRYFEKVLPGDTFTRKIKVTNNGDLPAVIDFSVLDFEIMSAVKSSGVLWGDFVKLSATVEDQIIYSKSPTTIKVSAGETATVDLGIKMKTDVKENNFDPIQGKTLDINKIKIKVVANVDEKGENNKVQQEELLVFTQENE